MAFVSFHTSRTSRTSRNTQKRAPEAAFSATPFQPMAKNPIAS